MPGTKSSDKHDEDDVPGRHYAIGHCSASGVLPSRQNLLAITPSEDFVPGYCRFALYCLPGS